MLKPPNSTVQGKNYINGEFTLPVGGTFSNINPAEEVSLGEFPQSTEEEIEAAFVHAKQTSYSWRRLSRLHRAEYFYRVAKIVENRLPEIATVISLETGKTYNESVAEVNEALHMAQYAFGSGRTPVGEAVASEVPEKESYMLRKPKGVVAIISPFNFPVAIGAFWCAAPALVEGNTVILKPSEDAPWSSQICAEIFDEAGIPPGVFNLIHGDGSVGDALVHKDVDHICFTGSAVVGKHIRRVCADSWNKTCSCEMGSKSAVLVFEDADFDLAMDACVASAFKLSGQRCVSASRLIIHHSLHDRFVKEFTNKVNKLVAGPPLIGQFNPSLAELIHEDNRPIDNVNFGPLINAEARDKVESYNNMVFEDPGCTVHLKGGRLERAGYFLTPTVYSTEWRDEPFLKNEVFGPHVSIIPFDQPEHAIGIYNDTDYGLAVGIVTENFKIAKLCRDNCDAGMIYWNGGSIAAESHLAFGGVKKSGNGYPSAARTFRAVTHEVSWTVNYADKLMFPQGMST
jgi:aldehyde dehydrogenase (NAD+)